MKSDFSPSRRAWNVIMTAVVWAAAVLVIALTVGVIGLVLVRGIPHISWEFLSTTASVLKGTDGILPAILNTLYVILLTLLIVLPVGGVLREVNCRAHAQRTDDEQGEQDDI